MSILSCLVCNEKFLPGKPQQVTCSRKCRDRARYLRKQADGTGYVPQGRKPGVSQKKSCIECGTSFVGTANQKFCANICNYRAKERRRAEAGYYQQAHVRQRQKEYSRAKYRQDLASGTAKGDGSRIAVWQERGASGMWDLESASGVCCVEGCGRALYARMKCKPHYEREMKLSGVDWALDKYSGNDYRRRAEKFGVPFEPINKWRVFDRDSWVCGICDEPVDRELAYPDPMSVSLDHVVPLSRGGGHIESNVQCSHLACNVQKGATYGEANRTASGRVA